MFYILLIGLTLVQLFGLFQYVKAGVENKLNCLGTNYGLIAFTLYYVVFVAILARGLYILIKQRMQRKVYAYKYPSELVVEEHVGPIEGQICAVYNDPLDIIDEEKGKFNFRRFIHSLE
jgi:hypothetical protein